MYIYIYTYYVDVGAGICQHITCIHIVYIYVHIYVQKYELKQMKMPANGYTNKTVKQQILDLGVSLHVMGTSCRTNVPTPRNFMNRLHEANRCRTTLKASTLKASTLKLDPYLHQPSKTMRTSIASHEASISWHLGSFGGTPKTSKCVVS